MAVLACGVVEATKETGRVAGGGANDALTAWAEFMVTLQPAIPEHAPPQPAKVDGDVGVAVSVTTAPVA